MGIRSIESLVGYKLELRKDGALIASAEDGQTHVFDGGLNGPENGAMYTIHQFIKSKDPKKKWQPAGLHTNRQIKVFPEKEGFLHGKVWQRRYNDERPFNVRIGDRISGHVAGC